MYVQVLILVCLFSSRLFLQFSDTTATDPQFVANGGDQLGLYFQAASVGIGSMMQQVGGLLGCPREETGIMNGDFVTLNRTFCMRVSTSLSLI